MKLTVEKKALENALKKTVYEKKAPLPILTAIHLQAKNRKLIVKGTNLEQYTTFILDAEVEEDGEVCIFGKTIDNIVKVLPDKTVELSLDKEKLKVKSGKTKYNIPTISTEDFPVFTEMPEKTLSVMAHQIVNGLEKTIYASSKERDTLKGIFIETFSNEIRFVATDGHRLALNKIELEEEPNTIGVIIPEKAALIVKSILKESEEELIDIATNGNSLFLRGENFIFETRILDYAFPNYKEIIDNFINSIEYQLIIKKDELEETIRRIAIADEDTIKRVVIEVKNDKMIVRLPIDHETKAEEEIELQENTEIETKVAFNSEYILDAIRSKDTEEIIFKFKDNNSPAIVLNQDNTSQIDIVMPLNAE
jgi:DNA polymerase-3 subunit beta